MAGVPVDVAGTRDRRVPEHVGDRLDVDAGGIEGSVQCWLDRHAMHVGAQADAIVAKYREGGD